MAGHQGMILATAFDDTGRLFVGSAYGRVSLVDLGDFTADGRIIWLDCLGRRYIT